MKKWNEITCRSALKLISEFINKEEWTLDKVLEIQDPISIITETKHRLYFGNCITVDEYKENPYTSAIKRMMDWKLLDGIEGMCSICMIEPPAPPLVLPLFRHQDHKNLPILGYKHSPTPRWYRKKGNTRIFYPSTYSEDLTNTYVRIRTFSKETWRNMISGYIKEGTELNSENDLRKEDFLIYDGNNNFIS